MKPFTAIGVDVGGTKIAAGVVRFPEGVLGERRIFPTLPERGAEVVLREVETVVRELQEVVTGGGGVVEGIGVGVCEIVDRAGRVASANCLKWPGLMVSERLGVIAPTVVEADVRAAALAEARFGAGRGARVFLYVTIGTGIASCLMIEGRPFLGACGATGTMASGPMPGFDERPTRASRPTLEQVAAGPALLSRFHQLGGVARTGQDLLAALAAGDWSAGVVARSAADALGGAVGWLVNVLDPELVVLGGGLGTIASPYRDAVIQAAREHIWWEGHRDLPIVSAETGSAAGIIGAAAAAWMKA